MLFFQVLNYIWKIVSTLREPFLRSRFWDTSRAVGS